MASQNFLRLPQHIQDVVTAGLDDEITDAFARIEEARAAGDEDQVRFLEGDILSASTLRKNLTGEDATIS